MSKIEVFVAHLVNIKLVFLQLTPTMATQICLVADPRKKVKIRPGFSVLRPSVKFSFPVLPALSVPRLNVFLLLRDV